MKTKIVMALVTAFCLNSSFALQAGNDDGIDDDDLDKFYIPKIYQYVPIMFNEPEPLQCLSQRLIVQFEDLARAPNVSLLQDGNDEDTED